MPTCTVCGQRPVDSPAAYACTPCTTTARRQLDDIADATPAARDVATGQARRGTPTRGHADGGRLPLDLTAVARLDSAQNAITTLARDVAETRGMPLPDTRAVDPLVVAARWLAGHLEWLRHRDDVRQAYADIRAARTVVRAVATGPAERRWLGQCGADLEDDTRCPADLHARPDAARAVCRSCKAEHDARARRAWLDGQTRDQAYTARQISQAYPQIPDGTIRSWAARGEITAQLEPLPAGVEGPLWVHRDAGGRPRPRYVLGDVLALAAAKAAARAEREARRQTDESEAA